MPEGPSIVILREEAERFVGRRVLEVEGNSRLDIARLKGRTLRGVRSWGKHFLMDFGSEALRVHFMLWGRYRIDDPSGATPRLALRFRNGRIDFYACSLRFLDDAPDALYDWSADVMADEWDPAAARRKLRARPDALVCDALLDQDVFAGVGNIIKNEVLFRVGVHPASAVGALPPAKLDRLIGQAREYSFEFLEWKRQHVLRQHWLVHTKRTCPTCGAPIVKAYIGKRKRRSFFCERCQPRY